MFLLCSYHLRNLLARLDGHSGAVRHIACFCRPPLHMQRTPRLHVQQGEDTNIVGIHFAHIPTAEHLRHWFGSSPAMRWIEVGVAGMALVVFAAPAFVVAAAAAALIAN
jgi:hypothetical protein